MQVCFGIGQEEYISLHNDGHHRLLVQGTVDFCVDLLGILWIVPDQVHHHQCLWQTNVTNQPKPDQSASQEFTQTGHHRHTGNIVHSGHLHSICVNGLYISIIQPVSVKHTTRHVLILSCRLQNVSIEHYLFVCTKCSHRKWVIKTIILSVHYNR